MELRRTVEVGSGGRDALGDIDRLSALPDCLIHCIMGCLPIGDAARTSILSEKFMHYWKGTPVLKFDEQFYKDMIEGKVVQFQFEGLVESIMARVNGPIEELTIHAPPSDKNAKMLDDGTTGRMLKLPFHIFNPSHLSKFSLKNCSLTDSLFSMPVFSSLVSLRLQLVLTNVELLEALIRSSAKLKDLVLIDLKFTDNSPLVVDAQELRTLMYRSSQYSICLNYVPCLASATIHSKIELPAGKLKISSFEQFFNLIPKIENLGLDNTAVFSLIDRRLPENKWIVLNPPDMLSSAMSLIRTSLDLKQLEINFGKFTVRSDIEMEVQVQYLESLLIAKIETFYSVHLLYGMSNDVIEFIREFIAGAILIRKKRNGTTTTTSSTKSG